MSPLSMHQKSPQPVQPFLVYGQVLVPENDLFRLATDFGPVKAKQAAGCLMLPAPGDMVLISIDENGLSYILTVLNRPQTKEQATDLQFHGQVNLHIKDGGLNVVTQGPLALTSEAKIACTSNQINLQADKGLVRFRRLSIIGGVVKSQLGRLKIVAGQVENTFRELTQRLFNSFRFVKEHDETQTQTSRLLVEDSYLVHSKYAEHLAKDIIRINGDQVHLG